MSSYKRADKSELEKIFRKYCTVQKDGEWYMTHEDLVCRYLGLVEKELANVDTVRLLASVADSTNNRLISFSEFRTMEGLLCSPDATSQLAFSLFDQNNTGRISFEDFKRVLGATVIHREVPFNFSCLLVQQYFGKEHKHQLDYLEFSQLLQSLPTEHAKQAFSSCDEGSRGTIPALQFVDLMSKIRGFRMSQYVRDHLMAVAGGSAARRVSYAYFKAFNQLLGNLDLLGLIVHRVGEREGNGAITEAQLLREAENYGQVTPLQVSLLFQMCNLIEQSGFIKAEDFQLLLPGATPAGVSMATSSSKPDAAAPGREKLSGIMEFVRAAYLFTLGGVAGAAGATAVYPIDLVKTRLQNQRGSLAGEIMYKNSWDCFLKVVKNEGFFGLYRGLLPQLVGVSPEKAIKLATNDTMRRFLTKKDGSLPFWRECVAGGCGGCAQVMFTNPLEIVKIRLQVAGEMAGSKVSAVRIVKELGFIGLYKGASACLLRDIPFSAIYFSTYAHMKLFTADKRGYNGVGSLFLSAFVAGVPAAALVTPADVIKTRLQVKARAGQDTYKGMVDCALKIYKTEGGRAFWKGAPARVFRSSPQFGVTLATYELLQRLFGRTFSTKIMQQPATPSLSQPTTAPGDARGTAVSSWPTGGVQVQLAAFPDHIGGFGRARNTFSCVENRFGLVFPRTRSSLPPDPQLAADAS